MKTLTLAGNDANVRHMSNAVSTRTVTIRNFPEDSYQLLRRLMFERGEKATQADVIAEALRTLATRS